jgi:hypothetical protein
VGSDMGAVRICRDAGRLISDHVLVLRNAYGNRHVEGARSDTAWMPADDRGVRGCGQKAAMLNIASEVYRVSPDRLREAQHVATRRALASLLQKGLVFRTWRYSVRVGRATVNTGTVRLIKHEAVPGCGSFEVRFLDDRSRQYFYWDDIPARRIRPETLDRQTAPENAKAPARTAQASV